MTISANSRYVNDSVVAIDDDGQIRNVIVLNAPTTTTFNYISHMWAVHDRLDNLANQYYGDPTQWWAIANANQDLQLINWNLLTPGTVIRIPVS